MVFSSLKFILYFLPFFLVTYTLATPKYKTLCIFLYSIVFYAFGCFDNMSYLLLLILSLVVNYFLALWMADVRYGKYKNLVFIIALLFDVGLLFVFKYFDFFVDIIAVFNENVSIKKLNLVLPIGISFWTFQILSYIIDVYRGDIKVEKSFINLSTYIIMFPQLIAGPIVRYRDIKDDLVSGKCDVDGIRIFIIGLAAKVIIANQLSAVGNDVMNFGLQNISISTAWLYSFSYTMQIYFDFWGYSLMAIGLGKLIGISIMKNFDMPFLSKSITEFWRRWHISLGTWFRDYVYIPLGGSRVGVYKTCINLAIVFILSGIWHGASFNFALWGLYFAVFIIVEKLFLYKLLNKTKYLGVIYVLIVVVLSFTIFLNDDVHNLMIHLSKLFDVSSIAENVYTFTILKLNYKAIVLSAIFLTPLPQIIYTYIKKMPVIHFVIILGMLALSIYLIYMGYNNPFIYFRF